MPLEAASIRGDHKPSSFPWAFLSLCFLPVIYVLSTGPAVLFLIKTGLMENDKIVKYFEAFYSPIRWLMEHNVYFHHTMQTYGKLWLD